MLLLLAAVFTALSPVGGQADPPLRTDPVEQVAADLQAFIPAAMRAARVPGLSVALVREGRVVWEEGFGVANALAGGAVTPETVFPAASLGKAVAAYLALQLVAEGRLSLDGPLQPLLREPWLPRSPAHDAVTLRHVLAHTSGLSNYLRDRRRLLRFEPGGNAASSLHATAGDLARFLVELSEGRYLDARLLAEMRTPQVVLGDDDAWGLGLALQQSDNGPSLWHWGSNPGVRAMMVVYPQHGLGVVVLANSGEAGDLVRAVAARALGGKTDWDG